MGFRDPVRRSRSATAASKRSPAILTVSAMPAKIDCRSWLIAAARSAVDIATRQALFNRIEPACGAAGRVQSDFRLLDVHKNGVTQSRLQHPQQAVDKARLRTP
jgi:hypothetical protein